MFFFSGIYVRSIRRIVKKGIQINANLPRQVNIEKVEKKKNWMILTAVP
jgi:hypothetical protein